MIIEAQARREAVARPMPDRLNGKNVTDPEYAKKIQLSSVPSLFPPYPGRTEFDIFASLHPANDADGDFYDFYLPKPNMLVLLIADVAGDKSSAVLFMATAKAIIRSYVESGMTTEEAFAAMNKKLYDGEFSTLRATAWMGMLDLEDGALRYVSAGHNPPLLRRKNGDFAYLHTRPESHSLSGKDAKYRRNMLALLPGDEIFLYTHGLTEAKNPEGRLYGEERLKSALNASNTNEAHGICSYIKADVDSFTCSAPQSDDMAMLCMCLKNLQTQDRIMIYPELASVSAIQDFLTRKMSEWQIAKKYANNVRIAIDEIYSNILRYSGATETQILCHRGDALTLTFMDNGRPYDPTAPEEPDEFSELGAKPGGLGIYMVRSSARAMEYAYEDGYNILTLTFDLNDRRKT